VSGLAIKERGMATSTTTVTFVGAKGGVGTTTVAAVHAVQLARRGRTVRLTSADPGGVDDLAAVLGVPAPGPGEVVVVIPGLTLADHPGPDVDNVVDAGTDCFSDHRGPVYVVVRNDYLSLRRALTVPQTTVGIVLITEPSRALGRRDVAEVLHHPIVAEVAVDADIARTVDAGVLANTRRLPPLLLQLARTGSFALHDGRQ
jgi:hypothetical protein